MGAADIALRIAAQHARDLRNTLVAGKDRHIGRRDAAARALAHENVMVSTRGDLRQMRDGEHLVIGRDAAHRFPNLESNAASDAGIDLVEDERGYAIEARQNRLEGEHDARQLAAGSDA